MSILPMKLLDVLAKVISTYYAVNQCISLFEVVSICLAQLICAGRDFDKLPTLKEFDTVVKKDDQIKPIVITFVDGGLEENPHFPKILDVAIDHFK